jgi:hypothetical protein
MRRLALFVALTPAALALFSACGGGGSPSTPWVPPDAGPEGGVGAACTKPENCRSGLTCTAGLCAPSRAGAEGTACTISAECKDGLYCGPQRTCTSAGPKGEGEGCGSDAECKSGLRCNLVGFAGVCQPEGMGDVGGKCERSADCFAGLACAGGACTPLPPNPNGPPLLGIPTWTGEKCAVEPGPTKAFFRVPRGTGDGDFYRLPFPNDVRLKNGKLDLSGHPTPGSAVLGFDVVDRYLRDLEANADGFGAWPTITLRFSGSVDFGSLKADGVVRFVDLDAQMGQPTDLGYGWIAGTARTKYVCDDWMALRPSFASPLAPGHRHAMFVTTAAKTAQNAAVARDADFDAVMAATAPADPALAAAHAAYAPFRTWLAAKSIDPSTILVAAVFTVGHPERTASRMPAAIAAAAPPVASSWVRCGDGPSPCPQATGDRACGTPDPAFDELHAQVTLPIFQKGSAPYLEPKDGGDVERAMDGTPLPIRTESVCLSLTVPKGAPMPAQGWPLAIFAHGTGGTFRSHVTGGVAKRLSAVDDGQGGTIRMAVLGIDQPEHGPRRGTSLLSPDTLFYNFANPGAARGNVLQGALDQLALVRLAKGLVLAPQASPTGAEIRFSRIVFWGHSQGATEGSLSIPYGDDVPAVVLSGQGASLVDALLGKSKPVNVAAALPIILEDLGVGPYHPVLALLQNALDPADPLHHARALVVSPPQTVTGRNVLMPFAQGDAYSPVTTQLEYALAAQLGVAQTAAGVTMPDGTLATMPPSAVPAGPNKIIKGISLSAFVREYAPPPMIDGHFVAFESAAAKADVDHFLADGAAGAAPPKVGR